MNKNNFDFTDNGIRDMKKSQMYPGILKTKTGLQDAYFDQNFKRLFENEKWRPPNAGLSSTKYIINIITVYFITVYDLSHLH